MSRDRPVKFDWDYIGTGMTFVAAVACDSRGLSQVATRSLGCTPASKDKRVGDSSDKGFK